MMRTTITISAALVLVASGAVHGLWTDRWTSDPEELKRAAERLARLPVTIGKWDGHDIDMSTDPRLGLAAVRALRYVHQTSGQVVSIYIACGRPGPACVHTPDACYPADGYREAEPARRVGVPTGGAGDRDAAPADFWTARYMRKRPDAQTNLRIWWAWHSSTGWKAPDNPRVAFAGESVLYKLYVIRELAHGNEPAEGDVSAEFMQELLPVLEERLFGS